MRIDAPHLSHTSGKHIPHLQWVSVVVSSEWVVECSCTVPGPTGPPAGAPLDVFRQFDWYQVIDFCRKIILQLLKADYELSSEP